MHHPDSAPIQPPSDASKNKASGQISEEQRERERAYALRGKVQDLVIRELTEMKSDDSVEVMNAKAIDYTIKYAALFKEVFEKPEIMALAVTDYAAAAREILRQLREGAQQNIH